MSSWRPALRIARRTVRRSLGRSALVAVLVGIPVAGATVVDVVYRTQSGPEHTAYLTMGDADAIIETTPFEAFTDDYSPANTGSGVADDDPGTAPLLDPAEVASLLPAGSELSTSPLQFAEVRYADGDRNVRAELVVLDLTDPRLERWARLESGQAPGSPDEGLVTRPLAERLGLLDDGGELRPDATVALRDGPEVRVTGLYLDPARLDAEATAVFPGSAAAVTALGSGAAEALPMDLNAMYGGDSYVVDLPDGVDADALWPALAEQGVRFVPRDAVLHPDRYAPPDALETPTSLRTLGLVALVVGLGLLEVILLAGAAFAVGARRQVRELGLLAANGATAGQIRRIVLAQGVVLGAIGSVLGIAAGAVIAVAGKPVWERLSGELIESWSFGAMEIALAAVVGLVSGLAAAIVPAIGAARMQPADALAQRFRATRGAARMPIAGLALLVLGAGGALVVSRINAGRLNEYARLLDEYEGTGRFITAPNTTLDIAAQLAGACVAVAGLVLLLPGLVTLVGRLGGQLPLSGRLAVRDAARHRHRTAPTLAAISVVVAGSIGLAYAMAGLDRVEDLQNVRELPDGVAALYESAPVAVEATPADDPGAFAAPVVAALPDAALHRVSDVVQSGVGDLIEQPVWASSWNLDPARAIEGGVPEVSVDVSVAVADQLTFALAAGSPPDAATREALAAGKIVVFDDALVDPDSGEVVLPTFDENGTPTAHIRVPAYVAERPLAYSNLPGAFIAEDALAGYGLASAPGTYIVTYNASATPDQLDAARDAADQADVFAAFPPSPDDGLDPMPLALAAGAALVTLVGVTVAVALSAVEGRADLATLAAVGAPPRRRRLLAGAQALLVGGLGTLIGVALGTYFAALAWPAIGAPDFIVPWRNLALSGAAVPALAVAVAMVFTPSRLPVVRRIA